MKFGVHDTCTPYESKMISDVPCSNNWNLACSYIPTICYVMTNVMVWQVAPIGQVFYIPMRMSNHQNNLGTLILPGLARFSTYSPRLVSTAKIGSFYPWKKAKKNMLRQADFWYVILWLSTYQWAKIQLDNFLFHGYFSAIFTCLSPLVTRWMSLL